jgi:phosphoglycolate phosphatase-like HAD superfamily hydrolase
VYQWLGRITDAVQKTLWPSEKIVRERWKLIRFIGFPVFRGSRMEPAYRTILFDLDGTLIDHFEAICRSLAFTLRQFGLAEPTMAEVRRAVGLGLEHAFRQLVGEENAEIVDRAVPVYREYFARTMLDDVVLLPGALELLGDLKARGIRAAILTNKHGPSSREIADHLGLTPFLVAVIGAQDTPWHKPDARLTAHALAAVGGDVASSLFVGDSPYDVQAAHNGGIPCWVVTTGTHTADELRAAGADAVHDDLASIGRSLFASA